jgi:hypothetical protein
VPAALLDLAVRCGPSAFLGAGQHAAAPIWGANRGRQLEVGEDAVVAEEGDGGDPVALERQHHDPVGARDRGLGVGEVGAERRLGVGPGGHHAQRGAAQPLVVAQQGGDRLPVLVAVFATTGSYASAQAFSDGLWPRSLPAPCCRSWGPQRRSPYSGAGTPTAWDERAPAQFRHSNGETLMPRGAGLSP